LIRVSHIGVEEGPVVERNASAEEALAAMKPFGLDWATVVSDGRLQGWVDRAALDGRAAVSEVTPKRFSAYVSSDSSLREALDSIVTSRTNVAVVVGEADRYLGVLTVERISREIVS
jgi:CBS domain-containing protein